MLDVRDLLLRLLASLCLDDHMGDVADGVYRVLKELGLEDKYEEDYDNWQTSVLKTLSELGVTTLYGTEISDIDFEEEDDLRN